MLSYLGLFLLLAFVSFFFGRLYERLGNGSSVPNAMDLASEKADLEIKLNDERMKLSRVEKELAQLKRATKELLYQLELKPGDEIGTSVDGSSIVYFPKNFEGKVIIRGIEEPVEPNRNAVYYALTQLDPYNLQLNGINSVVHSDPLSATEFGQYDPFQ